MLQDSLVNLSVDLKRKLCVYNVNTCYIRSSFSELFIFLPSALSFFMYKHGSLRLLTSRVALCFCVVTSQDFPIIFRIFFFTFIIRSHVLCSNNCATKKRMCMCDNETKEVRKASDKQSKEYKRMQIYRGFVVNDSYTCTIEWLVETIEDW